MDFHEARGVTHTSMNEQRAPVCERRSIIHPPIQARMTIALCLSTSPVPHPTHLSGCVSGQPAFPARSAVRRTPPATVIKNPAQREAHNNTTFASLPSFRQTPSWPLRFGGVVGANSREPCPRFPGRRPPAATRTQPSWSLCLHPSPSHRSAPE